MKRKCYALSVLLFASLFAFDANAGDWERIYYNDFGGNSASDPQIGSALSPGETLWDYDFDETCRFGYCILKHFDNNRNWYQGGDHTHPDNKEMGYYLLFNPNSQNKEIAAYRTKLNDLCKGLKIRFSAYVANLVKPNMSGSSPSLYPRLSLGVYKGETPEVKVSEQAYDMLDVPVSQKEESDQTLDWQKISIEFTLEADMECAYFIVSMVRPESNGWDFAIDDISIEVVQPETTGSLSPNKVENLSFFEEGGFLHVQNAGESFSYNISSLTGKQMVSGNTSNGLIPVSNLQPGVYFVTITVNGESHKERILLTGTK